MEEILTKEDVQSFLELFHTKMKVVDTLNNLGEMWVFGKDIRGREVYIKIMISGLSGQTICISFHIAESPMKYPFK